FLASWAIVAYIGIGNSIVDFWMGITKPLYVEKNRKRVKAEAATDAAVLDWRSVLYHGHADGTVPHFTSTGNELVVVAETGAADAADVDAPVDAADTDGSEDTERLVA
ncbi:hypothetical protein AB4Z22_41515, partial [Paenibacillus sp. TAF58]